MRYKSINDQRAENGFPPLPPMDRFYRNNVLMKRPKQVRFILNSKTLSGDLLRLEFAWRNCKRAFRPFTKPILDYLK
jgi:hypothetical protein